MARTQRTLNKKRQIFLELLRQTANVSKSARAALATRSWLYKQRAIDPEFAAQWDDAVEEATDLLIEEARRRAQIGLLEPVYYQGQVCGHIRKYSDVLLMFLIKARRKEYATERREHSDCERCPHKTGAHREDPALTNKLGEIFERVGAKFDREAYTN